ncbi:MAG: PQQ-binding-like beta-propeller repeat protein, partial [Phycisphaeraceae bacterium]|nr:PQQ-binding-like beta-propeller repeat protein [Phycisphaeraceae bacterium]
MKIPMIFAPVSIASGALLAATVALGAGGWQGNVDWRDYLGDKGRTLYSPLSQINRENVATLEVAWSHDTGERGEYQSNNLIVDGVLYTATPQRRVMALDAATGRERWTWTHDASRFGPGRARQRGLVFWQNERGGERRLFTAVGNHLFAIDASSGQVISTFGEGGTLHLGGGLDVEGEPNVGLNTPGVVYRDLLIIGGHGGPGAVRAFDV